MKFSSFLKQNAHFIVILITMAIFFFSLQKIYYSKMTMPEKCEAEEIAEQTAVDLLEIELKLIDGVYKVDNAAKQWQIDIT